MRLGCSAFSFLVACPAELRVGQEEFKQKAEDFHCLVPSSRWHPNAGFPWGSCRFFRAVAPFPVPCCDCILQLTSSLTLFGSRSVGNSLFYIRAFLSGVSARWLKVGHCRGGPHWPVENSWVLSEVSGVYSLPPFSLHPAVYLSFLFFSFFPFLRFYINYIRQWNNLISHFVTLGLTDSFCMKQSKNAGGCHQKVFLLTPKTDLFNEH